MPPRGGWDDWVLGWTPEGKILVRMNRVPWSNRMGRYYVVDPAGGLETPLELPEGGSASLSADGNVATKAIRKLTNFDEYDVLWPSWASG